MHVHAEREVEWRWGEMYLHELICVGEVTFANPAKEMERAALPVLEKGYVGDKVPAASGAPVMVAAHFKMAVEFLVRVKVRLAGEAIVVVFVVPEVIQQSSVGREISTIRAVIPTYLEMADVVAARVGDVLALCHVIDKFSIASLAVVECIAMDQVLGDGCVVLGPAAAWSAVLRAIMIGVASIVVSKQLSNGHESGWYLHQVVHCGGSVLVQRWFSAGLSANAGRARAVHAGCFRGP